MLRETAALLEARHGCKVAPSFQSIMPARRLRGDIAAAVDKVDFLITALAIEAAVPRAVGTTNSRAVG